jgi:PhoH-like ATPase
LSRYYTNEYVLMRNADGGNQNSLGRITLGEGRDASKATVKPLVNIRDSVWGLRPRNKEQYFALDALLDDDIKLVTLIGKAGTGKTLLAIAAGLRKVTDEQNYGKLVVSRPIFPMGRDIGYLPGTVEEKLNPWMSPIFDNVEHLMGVTTMDKRAGRGAQELIDMGIIEIEPLTYIRGRSLPNLFLIVDEAQNLTPHEVKTIMTRVGEGTKIVLTGDPYQIDNPYVDSESNGLTYVVSKFKGESIAATVSLFKGERSQLAELSANLL